MRIFLNGEAKNLSDAPTVEQLLQELGLTGRRVAVEINREVVPRSGHACLRLREDDRIEVVVAIGGG